MAFKRRINFKRYNNMITWWISLFRNLVSIPYGQVRPLKSIFGCIVACIVISFLGCGRPQTVTLATSDLPSFGDYFYYGHLDISMLNVKVDILGNDDYFIGLGYDTNVAGLTRRISELTTVLGGKPLILIRARAEAQFGDVWRVVELSATNSSGYLLAVKIRSSVVSSPSSRSSVISRLKGSIVTEDLIMLNISSLSNVSSDRLTVTCKTDGLFASGDIVPVEQLENWVLEENKRMTPSKRDVLMGVTSDCPYQKVVRVLRECCKHNIKIGLCLKSELHRESNFVLDVQLFRD